MDEENFENALTVRYPALDIYLIHSNILLVKLILLYLLTAKYKPTAKEGVLKTLDHEDVNIARYRRAYRSELLSVALFLATGLLYVLTKPSLRLAEFLMRLNTLASFLHTVCQAIALRWTPARMLPLAVFLAINAYMALSSIATLVL